MGEVREDLNGFGRRLDTLSHSVTACQASREGQIKRLETDTERIYSDIGKIFSELENTNIKIASLNGKMVGVGLLLALVVPVATALAVKLIG